MPKHGLVKGLGLVAAAHPLLETGVAQGGMLMVEGVFRNHTIGIDHAESDQIANFARGQRLRHLVAMCT